MVAITEEQQENLSRSLRRIFAFSISKMTTREVKNALNETFSGNKDIPKAIYEALLTGKIKETQGVDNLKDLSKFVEQYSQMVRIAQEVAEKGEFLNVYTCDILQQGNQVFFVNLMRRIDGQEFFFQSKPEINIRLAHMFVNRLRDLQIAVGGATLNDNLKEELRVLINDIKTLL